eukprot:m.33943 g.33943  ORF g.33943 m.33943 type:complete len:90 (-) comp10949_c0_seq1:39-308(-)
MEHQLLFPFLCLELLLRLMYKVVSSVYTTFYGTCGRPEAFFLHSAASQVARVGLDEPHFLNCINNTSSTFFYLGFNQKHTQPLSWYLRA